ncbi:hypothetical protein [Mycobacterium botniense]|uniref:Uncharacterized protein n=1 Tax=Mycobacterium botniense TaxID=84962 RepID=A0A7I9XY84_9MYCO|nr:hypothetical protein [Mycobacterium botniense]GFG74748.1 hypothetical protein MBOT_21130 [Mycobacterium botniense]
MIGRLVGLVEDIRNILQTSLAPVERPGAASKRPAPDPAIAEAAGAGHPKLLRAAAHQLAEWAKHIDCPAPYYCCSLANDLSRAADRLQAHK